MFRSTFYNSNMLFWLPSDFWRICSHNIKLIYSNLAKYTWLQSKNKDTNRLRFVSYNNKFAWKCWHSLNGNFWPPSDFWWIYSHNVKLKFANLATHVWSQSYNNAINNVLMSSCPHVLMSSCPHVLMSSCPHVLMSSCPHVLMSSWQLLSTFANPLQRLAIFGIFWQLLATFGNPWQLLAGSRIKVHRYMHHIYMHNTHLHYGSRIKDMHQLHHTHMHQDQEIKRKHCKNCCECWDCGSQISIVINVVSVSKVSRIVFWICS